MSHPNTKRIFNIFLDNFLYYNYLKRMKNKSSEVEQKTYTRSRTGTENVHTITYRQRMNLLEYFSRSCTCAFFSPCAFFFRLEIFTAIGRHARGRYLSASEGPIMGPLKPLEHRSNIVPRDSRGVPLEPLHIPGDGSPTHIGVPFPFRGSLSI